jgi:hypothetical protein
MMITVSLLNRLTLSLCCSLHRQNCKPRHRSMRRSCRCQSSCSRSWCRTGSERPDCRLICIEIGKGSFSALVVGWSVTPSRQDAQNLSLHLERKSRTHSPLAMCRSLATHSSVLEETTSSSMYGGFFTRNLTPADQLSLTQRRHCQNG